MRAGRVGMWAITIFVVAVAAKMVLDLRVADKVPTITTVVQSDSPASNPDPPALVSRVPAKIDPAGAWVTADKYTFAVKCIVGLAIIPPEFVKVEGGVDVNTDGCEAECALDECFINVSAEYTAGRPISFRLGQKMTLHRGFTYWAVNPADIGGP